jgi:hypothetical protein
MQVDVPILTRFFPIRISCYIRTSSCSVEPCVLIVHHKHSIQNSGRRGSRERLHAILRVATPLGSVGLICCFPNSIDLISSASIFSLMFCKIFAILANILGWSNLDIGHTGSLVPGIEMTDMSPEVVVFKVAGRFLPMTRSTGYSAVAR